MGRAMRRALQSHLIKKDPDEDSLSFLFFLFVGFRRGSLLTNIVNNLESFGAQVVLVNKAVEAFDFRTLTELF
jgi:hypothetical protein